MAALTAPGVLPTRSGFPRDPYALALPTTFSPPIWTILENFFFIAKTGLELEYALHFLYLITFFPQAAGLDPAHLHRRRHARRRAEYIP